MTATLVGQAISHTYGDTAVLSDVDLTATTGEWLAVVGPSGSGKTTLLSILGGLLTPTAGRIRMHDGDDTVDRPEVAWVLQTTNALGRRSALDNVAIGALSSGATAADAAATARGLLAAVGLEHRVDARSASLSGGERQRLSIARGLAQGRRFLLADEPTGQLDAATSDAVISSMRAATTDVGVVLATHDDRLLDHCDRVARLDNGVLR